MSEELKETESQRLHRESEDWFNRKMKGTDLNAFMKAARSHIARSRSHYTEMSRWVNGEIGGELLNPEYIARAENTKKLREQLKKYAGSSDAASDILFSMKKEAEGKGQDFSMAALDKIDEIIGKTEAPEITFVPVKPKKTLAGRLAHQLWKMGFPMGKLFKDKLEVEEADKK